MIDSGVIKSNNIDYDFSSSDMVLVRESVEGETALKNSDQVKVYLPDPRYVDTTSQNYIHQSRQAEAEYNTYLNGADYDNFPEATLSSWVGMLDLDKASFEMPDAITHLLENADGDGLPLIDLMELTATNIFQMKFHCILVEYGNEFGDTPEEEITKQQAQALGLRSSLKSYVRESLVDWDYGLVDGVKKLKYAKLKEDVVDSDYDALTQEEYTNYLVLALDEDGYYYQKKFYRVSTVGNDSEGMEESERIYPEANGQRLTELPLYMFFDQQVQTGVIPRQMGALYPICRKAISMFRTSADLNRALKVVGIPTVFTAGWNKGDDETFREVNEGRSSITFGSGTSNNLPGDVSVQVVQMDGTNQPLFTQMDKLTERAKSLGAKIQDTDSQNKTAEQVRAENAKETALLVNVANSLQNFEKVLQMAARFEGKENAEVSVILNKDFTSTKISVEERKQIVEEYGIGLLSKDESRQLLIDGGIPLDEVDDIIGSQSNADDMNVGD